MKSTFNQRKKTKDKGAKVSESMPPGSNRLPPPIPGALKDYQIQPTPEPLTGPEYTGDSLGGGKLPGHVAAEAHHRAMSEHHRTLADHHARKGGKKYI